MCDADGDGQVTFDEFYKLMSDTEPKAVAPVLAIQAPVPVVSEGRLNVTPVIFHFNL